MRLVAGLLAVALIAAAPEDGLKIEGTPEQGGVMRGTVPAGTTLLTLDGKPVKTSLGGRFLIGFGRDAEPKALLVWTKGGQPVTRVIDVAPRQWRIQSLPTLPPRPVPDAEFEARRPAEIARIAAARADIGDSMAWDGRFRKPAKGPISGVYGSQRIFSGTPAAPHSGLDIAAGAGAPVLAPAAGIVRLADGPFTLEGNLVMIDHGFGLVSAFLHLSRIDVVPGALVERGQQIGTVGRTGRATGPHLHWGVTWTDVRVDPARLIDGGSNDR
ncbi:peptidase [Polymorphobacter glacialis]|uniref:Peptidase n=1 Tax=Sandarakinorhabdus glacialis TaxID=1614636 RepID=A0A916ZTR2_9SPHN|nr:M23 family metallopeptidase [Polymorphobacter glacialis]GGE13463.1 peptidase [Polymorphobacter glacialis]